MIESPIITPQTMDIILDIRKEYTTMRLYLSASTKIVPILEIVYTMILNITRISHFEHTHIEIYAPVAVSVSGWLSG